MRTVNEHPTPTLPHPCLTPPLWPRSVRLDRVGAEFLEFRVVTRRGERRRQSSGGGGGGSGVTRKEGGAGDRVSGSSRRSSDSVGSGSGGDDAGAHYAVVWRRFSAFRSLHNDVTSLLWGSHLLDCLPPLPGKPPPPPRV